MLFLFVFILLKKRTIYELLLSHLVKIKAIVLVNVGENYHKWVNGVEENDKSMFFFYLFIFIFPKLKPQEILEKKFKDLK